MEFSVSNVFEGKVVNYNCDSISAQVFVELTGGQDIVASISKSAFDSMAIEENMKVKVYIKGPDVIVGRHIGREISTRNKFEGRIDKINLEKIHSEVILDIGNSVFLDCILSTDSVKRLNFKEGEAAEAVIKSNNVMLSKC